MNELVKHRIESFIIKYDARLFDQDDVYLLLIDLRDSTKKDSLARELGDFLAHPHERDKGLTWEVLNRTYKDVLNSFEDIFSGKAASRASLLCTELDIIGSVCEGIKSAGIHPGALEKPLNDSRAKDFMLCVVGLLSSCIIKVGDRCFPLSLELGRDGRHLCVFANIKVEKLARTINMAWPILRTSCRVNDACLTEFFPWGQVKYFVARRQGDGSLKICKLETDKKRLINTSS